MVGGEAVGTSYIRHNLLVAAILSSLGFFPAVPTPARVCGSTHPVRLSSTGPQTPQPPPSTSPRPTHRGAAASILPFFPPIRCALCLCTADACKAHKRVTWVLAWCKGVCKDGFRGLQTHTTTNAQRTQQTTNPLFFGCFGDLLFLFLALFFQRSFFLKLPQDPQHDNAIWVETFSPGGGGTDQNLEDRATTCTCWDPRIVGEDLLRAAAWQAGRE